MDTSRIKVIFAGERQTNKCLAEQLGAATAAVSKWSANNFTTETGSIIADYRTC